MGQLDLQPPFSGCRAFAEDFQDQPGPVDHLALQLLFEIALLDRRKRTVDDHQLGLALVAGDVDVLDLAFAEQGAGPRLADRDGNRVGYLQPDRQRQAARFLEPRRSVDCGGGPVPEFRVHDQRPRAAGYLFAVVVKKAQSSSPSSSSQPSPVRSTGPSGWMVETACL